MSATTLTTGEGFFSSSACKRSTNWLGRCRSRQPWASAVESAQHFLILIQPREQPSRSAARDDCMLRRDELSVARELFNAKQLRPQGQFARTLAPHACPCQ